MPNIEYVMMDEQGLDVVGPLWEKLREHHRTKAREFAEFFTRVNYAQRKDGLLKTAAAGKLRVDLVRDSDASRYLGYCITSLSADKKGEIESIFVESDYRGHGIGDCLMRRALQFLDDEGAQRKTLGVGVGNEEVFAFYRRYGFVPRVTILEQVPDPSC